MKQLGISIYSEHSTVEKDKAYIELAHKYGFTRIFTCLLSVEENQEIILQEFKEIIDFAHARNFEITVDISPNVLQRLGISYDDLSFFQKLGADCVRLDLGFTGMEEALMTYNPYGIKIEINMSNSAKYLENIASYRPNFENLRGSHNFYPQRYSGLSLKHFTDMARRFKKFNLKTAAFISSQAASYGPWPIMEGLPTLEMHRDMRPVVQAKHLFATGLIDDVLIGNAYASEEELKTLSELNPYCLTFTVALEKDISPLEEKIVLAEPHLYRGDLSDYLIRSSASRVKYKDESIRPGNTINIRRGDVLIANDNYGQYKGELQVALLDMENSGKKNVVGHIVEDEIYLMDYLNAWDNFAFVKEEKR